MDKALAFWLGSCLGSFLNVVILRLPKGRSIVSPPSRCPHCRAQIAWHDNIPILSWLLLRGRCRRCRKPISPRYPAVELVFACLSLALWLRWGAQPLWAGCAILASGVLVAVALIDWDTFLIPDELSLGLLAAAPLICSFNPIIAGSAPAWYSPYLVCLRGAAVGFALCWAVAAAGEKIFGKEAMGGGDIKLLAAIGAWSGGLGAFDCLMVGSLLGSAYGIAQMAGGKLKRSDPIPFGPFLAAGAVFNFFYVLPLGFPFV
ncbi:MAG: prepilin peptidase [Elusimicrobia bacterium]|nr:prepilin peptidase [Elusimicrobiota bacterium]